MPLPSSRGGSGSGTGKEVVPPAPPLGGVNHPVPEVGGSGGGSQSGTTCQAWSSALDFGDDSEDVGASSANRIGDLVRARVGVVGEIRGDLRAGCSAEGGGDVEADAACGRVESAR